MTAIKKHISFFAVLALTSALASPQAKGVSAIDSTHTEKPHVVSAWVGDSIPTLYAVSGENPALAGLLRPHSLTVLGLDYGHMRRDSIIDPQSGKGLNRFGMGASTYTRAGKSMVLQGHASYHRQEQKQVVWNETSDYAMIYPYLSADSIGGDLQGEIYDFGGAYSDRRGSLLWGAALDYTAGLYWRSVDPRPRNVTSNLRARAGIAYSLSHRAVLGLALRYTRYKQTSSIAFASEMGVDKVYHLIGLGLQYQRWGGLGLSTHYNANLWGLSLDLRPDGLEGTGASASFSYDGMAMDVLLTDLNKLPMAHISTYRFGAKAGWSWTKGYSRRSIVAYGATSLRQGTENIFGDPAGSIYPQIGSLNMYRHRLYDAGIEGLWTQRHGAYGVLTARLASGYHRSSELYISPRQKMSVERWRTALEVSATAALKGKTLGHLAAGAEVSPVLSSSYEYTLTGTSPNSLLALTRLQYNSRSANTATFFAGIGATFAVGRLALRPQLKYVHQCYNGISADTDAVEAAVLLAF